MSQLTRLHILDSIQAGKEYSATDIWRAVKDKSHAYSEAAVTEQITILARNKALKKVRQHYPYTYQKAEKGA